MNTINYQILKQKSPNMILIIFFLKHNYDNWLENEKESTDTEESTDKQNR